MKRKFKLYTGSDFDKNGVTGVTFCHGCDLNNFSLKTILLNCMPTYSSGTSNWKYDTEEHNEFVNPAPLIVSQTERIPYYAYDKKMSQLIFSRSISVEYIQLYLVDHSRC